MSGKKSKIIIAIATLFTAFAFVITAVLFSSCSKKDAPAAETTVIETEKPVDDFSLTMAGSDDQSGVADTGDGLYTIPQNEDYEVLTGYELE